MAATTTTNLAAFRNGKKNFIVLLLQEIIKQINFEFTQCPVFSFGMA